MGLQQLMVSGNLSDGEWFVMIGDELIAHGDDFKTVVAKAEAVHPGKELFIAQMPKKKVMLL